MHKESFEQPAGNGGDTENLSQEEKDELIDEEAARLQKLMDAALTTVKMAVKNKFVAEEKAENLYEFLEAVNEEISEADMKSGSTEETLERLRALGKLLLLPAEAEKEKRLEEDGRLLLQRLEEWNARQAESKKPRQQESRLQNQNKNRTTRNFYLSRQNKNHRKREGYDDREIDRQAGS